LVELRGHDCKLFEARFRFVVRKFSFSSRVVDNWPTLQI